MLGFNVLMSLILEGKFFDHTMFFPLKVQYFLIGPRGVYIDSTEHFHNRKS